MQLEGPDGCNDDGGVRCEFGFATLDVEEFLRPQVCAESRLSNDVVRQFQRGCCCEDGIATMGNVCEWTAMKDGRIVLQCLYQVGLHRVS